MTEFHSAATLNIPAAKEVLDYLRAHPEEHNQDFFMERTHCGTVMCIAGTAAFLDPETTFEWTRYGDLKAVVVNQERVHVQDHAAQLLGLTRADADYLFFTEHNDEALAVLSDWIDRAEHHQGFTHVPF